MTRIDLTKTHALHERLLETWRGSPERFAAADSASRDTLARRGTRFERTKVMPSALSALLLDPDEVQRIGQMAQRLHGLTEKALDWVLASPERLVKYFPDHRRMVPYLRKTPGLSTWQGVSRYDAVVTAAGQLKIMELNTGCPAGFYHAEEFSRVTEQSLEELGLSEGLAAGGYGTIAHSTLMDEVLAIEAGSGIGQDLIVLMNDENGLLNELDLMHEDLSQRGRQAVIASAADLRMSGERLTHEGKPVSLTYNKIRVSTPDSPGWNWKPGFEQRYAGFLEGIERGAMASVNNLCGLSVAEDKSLLWVMQQPEFQETLSAADRLFLDELLLWTWPLRESQAGRSGRTFALGDYVAAEQQKLVVKPANEGRGFRVELGAQMEEPAWRQACQNDPVCPSVVQEYAAPARLPVVFGGEGGLRQEEMYLTLGLFVIRGRYRGMFSRVSANPVTNVGKSGLVQAVFVSAG